MSIITDSSIASCEMRADRRIRRVFVAKTCSLSLALSAVLCASMLFTPDGVAWWSLGLTIGGACSMLAASRDHPVGWALGLALQLPWGVYALMTDQPAFVITTVLCAAANVSALHRKGKAIGCASTAPPAEITGDTPIR